MEFLNLAVEFAELRDSIRGRLRDLTPTDKNLNTWQAAVLDQIRREDRSDPRLKGSKIVHQVAKVLLRQDQSPQWGLSGAEASDAVQEDIDLVDGVIDIGTMADRLRYSVHTLKVNDPILTRILEEARLAYSVGLFGSTALLCRTALELGLRRLVRVGDERTPLGLMALIGTAIEQEIIGRDVSHGQAGTLSASEEKEIAYRIRERGREWAHGLPAMLAGRSEKEMKDLLWDTIRLMEVVQHRKPRIRGR